MRLITAAFLAISLALPALAQGSGGPASITVTGEGKVEMRPDMATVTLGVQTQEDDASTALSGNSESVAAVLNWLTEAGVAETDMQTSGLSLSPVYGNSRSSGYEAPEVVGFMASNMVTVRVKALDSLGGVLDAVVKNGANTFNGLSFGLQDPAPATDDARRRAVADARHRAELYAEAAGVTLGEVLSISEQSGYNPPQPMMMREAAFDSSGSVPVAEGQVEVSATVTIVYAIAGE